MQFGTTDTASTEKGVKVLVYGQAGSGKTTLAGTAPAPLIIDAESGLLPLRHLKLPVISVTDITDLYTAYNWIVANAKNYSIETIVLDSLSEIIESVFTNEKAKSKDGRQIYTGLEEESTKLIKGFRALPFNVVCTCKETRVKNEVTGIERCVPKAPGNKITPELPYLFDEVFHAAVGKDASGNEFYYLRTRLDTLVEAKDRSGVLDPIEYPDLGAIFNKIKGT